MQARDFRSIGRAAQEALRRRAIVLVEHERLTQAAAATAVGVQRQTVNIWLKRYRERARLACSTGVGLRLAKARGR